MSDYTELVKTLRGLANGTWKNCEYTWFAGEEKVFADAAAAIDELQFQLDCVNDSVKALSLPIDGKWIRVEDGESYHYECSRCGERPLYSVYGAIVLSGTCPNCGADMRKMEETEDEVHSDI